MTRPATVSDAAAIARLTVQLGYSVEPGEVAERLSRILSREDRQLLIAELDGHPVGWVHMSLAEYIDAAPFVVVGGLVVDRDHRRKGVARMLMSRAEEWARQRGCAVVRLVSSSTRTGAHRFYERIGYTIIKTQYAFAKPLEGDAKDVLQRFVPRVQS